MLRMILNSPRRQNATPSELRPAGNYTTTTQHDIDNQSTTNNDGDDSDSMDADADSDVSNHTLLPATVDDEETLEPWIDWIRRCTHEAEAQMTSLGIQDWVAEQRRREMAMGTESCHRRQ